MKTFKKFITSILACSLVFACCFGLVGCDETPNNETPPATEPEIETITLSAEQAEAKYYAALLNSLYQTSRHETVTIKSRSKTETFKDESSIIVVVNDGISYLNNDSIVSWVINNKLYKVAERKYYENYGPIDIHEGALEFAQLQSESDSQEIIFLGGEKTGETSTIGIKYSYTYDQEELIFHISAQIENNLIVSYSMATYSHCEIEMGDGYYQATISYENVNFPTAIPTDLGTYTKAD